MLLESKNFQEKIVLVYVFRDDLFAQFVVPNWLMQLS